MDEYRNSILQIFTTQRVYDTFEPYKEPEVYEGTASAFIIDIQKGFVLTSAHVIKNASHIYAKSAFVDKKLSIRIKSHCLERDIALLVLSTSSVKLLNTVQSLSISDEYLTNGTPVVSLGYPLGGDLSISYGYHLEYVDIVNQGKPEVLTWEEYPSYMMMEIVLNSGNSGGPIFNKHGKVIGMVSGGHLLNKDIGYGVPMYSFSSIYEALASDEGPLRLPKFSFTYQKVNPDMAKIYENEGIIINEMKENSIFDKAKKHDMITGIKFNDKKYTINNNGLTEDENGNIRTFKNLVMEIPIYTPISLNIVRLGKKINHYMVETTFTSLKEYPTGKDYILTSGMCLMELNNQHIEREPCWLIKDRKSVIITHIFEGSVLESLNICQKGTILKFLNGKSVKSLSDVKKNLNNEVLTFEFEEGKIFVIRND
jgi:serine protease Do